MIFDDLRNYINYLGSHHIEGTKQEYLCILDDVLALKLLSLFPRLNFTLMIELTVHNYS